MSIRLAVACALAVFLLSIALIIGIGLAQPAHPAAVEAAPPAQQSDVSQMKRDFLQAQPVNTTKSESLPPAPAQPDVQQNGTGPAVAPAQPAPVVAQPPPPPPDYYYTTRAS